MRFIEHIILPDKLLLAWQAMDESNRLRHIVAELNRNETGVSLRYLTETADFSEAIQKGFEAYPAFPNVNTVHQNVFPAFMRRLPPRSRGDFSQYLAELRLLPDNGLDDFALLGYSGARLPSDGFSIIHPFDNVGDRPCELLIEAAGFRHLKQTDIQIAINDEATFVKEFNSVTQEEAVRIMVGEQTIGYVNRGLIPTFLSWLTQNRIAGAWIEKMNGNPNRPNVYLFVSVNSI